MCFFINLYLPRKMVHEMMFRRLVVKTIFVKTSDVIFNGARGINNYSVSVKCKMKLNIFYYLPYFIRRV